MRRFYDHLPQALEQGQPFALALIAGSKGSSPQKTGAKALFFGDGRIVGTLGGGCLEAEVQDRARRALLTQQPCSFELVLDHDFGWDDGLICGGKVSGLILPNAAEAGAIWRELSMSGTVREWGVRANYDIAWVESNSSKDNSEEWLYRERVVPACRLWIAGSGHIAQAVAALAVPLDFEVTIFDDRPALANSRYFPEGTRFEVDHWDRLLERPAPQGPTFGLIATRGHQHDAMVLRHWIQYPLVFLGMVGSRRKARLIFGKFEEEGLATEEQLGSVACPVGIDIKAVSVSEIALSVMAQYVRVRAEKVFHVNRSPFVPAS